MRGDEDPWAEEEAAQAERMDAAMAADEEIAEMEAAGNAIAAARRAGKCAHQGAVGYSGGERTAQQEGLKPGQLRCNDGGKGCGRVFGSDEGWYEAMDEAMYG